MDRFFFLTRSVSFLTRLLTISQDATRPTVGKDGRLKIRTKQTDNEKKAVEIRREKFVQEIGLDGHFMIRMLENNAGDVVTTGKLAS